MENDIKTQISEHYFQGYYKKAAQGPGLRARLTRFAETGLMVMGGCAAMGAAIAALPVLVPAFAASAFTLSYGLLITGAAIGLSGIEARRQTKIVARQNIARDIENGQLLNRYKSDLIADEQRKLTTATQILPVLEQVSKLEDFQKVAVKRAEIVQDLTAQRAAAAQKSKNTNSLS